MEKRWEKVNVVRWGDRAPSTQIGGYQIADVYRQTHICAHTLSHWPFLLMYHFVSILYWFILIFFLTHGRLRFLALKRSHRFSLITSFPISLLPLSFHIFTPSYEISPSLGFQVSRFFTPPPTSLFLILFPFGPSVSNLSKNCPFLNLWLSIPFFISLFEPITLLPAPSFCSFSLINGL